MAGNTFGKSFRLITFGESHGIAIGGIIDGCPAGIDIDEENIQSMLDKRRPGQSAIVSQRKEDDRVEFLSGIFEGKTLGTPIGFIIKNKDSKPADYHHLKSAYRPSHADYTWEAKYGVRDHRGGGRASARETACRVVGGAIAVELLKTYNISIHSWVSSVGELSIPENQILDMGAIYSNEVRCPHTETANKMIELIKDVRSQGDSLGGIITCSITGVPPGLGEPVFDKLHADLGKAMLSINAVKGFEIGSGFEGSSWRGSRHNDPFTVEKGKIRTISNFSGGIQGGISNGEDIIFRTAFKPTATIIQKQETISTSGEPVTLEGKGRHDPCVVPRAVPIVQSMAALVITDHLLRNRLSKF